MSASPEYSLTLLGEFAHTLDALPIDLARNFAELREMDAVLTSHMSSITSKLTALTEMIEQGQGNQERRLWMLMDIAQEASRMRHGSDDKIRVASQAADALKYHSQHLRALAEDIPGFDPTTLNWRTTYPHVATRSFMPPALLENGRRRRGGFASLLAPDPTPLKRKRGVKDDDQSPKKVADGAPRGRGGRKKIERPPSPTESVLSVTSHIPPVRPSLTSRASSSAVPKRARPARGGSGQPEYYDQPTAGPSRLPPSSAHPSLAYQHPNGNGHATAFDLRHAQGTPAPDWAPPHAQMLEGPGMIPGSHTPLAASAPASGGAGDAPTNGTDTGGDGEADGDDTLYCFCQRVSFGQMIACDDSNCQWEWFHIACIGLAEPPDGRWFCESCKGKRGGKRPGRGGRRKGGGRARAN